MSKLPSAGPSRPIVPAFGPEVDFSALALRPPRTAAPRRGPVGDRLVALGLAFGVAAVLAGCAATPAVRGPSAGAGAPAATAAPPSPPPRVEPAAAEVALSEAEQRRLLDEVRQALDQGREDEARQGLRRVLAADPRDKVALDLQQQLDSDPRELLGAAFWSYKVGPRDTLATIAQRFLGDADRFVALARYNGIAVPARLAAGQTLRIPGKRPATPPPPPPAPGVRGERPAPAAAATPSPAAPAPAPSSGPAGAASASAEPGASGSSPRTDKAERAGTGAAAPASSPASGATTPGGPGRGAGDEVGALLRQARTAMARQDLCQAIGLYDRVLRQQPGHPAAQGERNRALELKSRLSRPGC